MGIAGVVKVVAAMKMLAYGVSADMLDDALEMSETTIAESTIRFCEAVVAALGKEYLRAPNEEDVKSHLESNAKRGFPGMFGSIDCMHWFWKVGYEDYLIATL